MRRIERNSCVGSRFTCFAQQKRDGFDNFRTELERHIKELRLESDPAKLEIKKQNAIHELSEVQVREIENKLGQIKRSGVADSVILAGGLAGAVATGGWSVIASLFLRLTK